MADFVYGIIFAIVIIAVIVVIFQLFLMGVELNKTLTSVRQLTDQIKHDIEPTMKEVNGILEKVNGTMENLETLNKKVKVAQQKADKAWNKTKGAAGQAKSKAKDYFTVVKVGVLTTIDVLKGQDRPPEAPALQEAKKEVTLPPKEENSSVT